MDPIVIGIITTVLGVWLGSVEVRMKNMQKDLHDVPTRHEVSEEITMRQEALKVMQKEIKEDIHDMKRTLEKLVDKN